MVTVNPDPETVDMYATRVPGFVAGVITQMGALMYALVNDTEPLNPDVVKVPAISLFVALV